MSNGAAREGKSGSGARPLGLFAIGMALAASVALVERGCVDPGASTTVPAHWVADRGASAVFGLDARRLVTRRVPLPHPVALAAGAGGRWWALCAVDGWSGGAHFLALRSAEGEPLLEIELDVPGPARLVPEADGGVFVLPSLEGAPWQRFGPQGRPREPPAQGPGVVAAQAEGMLLVGGRGGALRSFAGAREVAARDLACTLIELAPGPAGGGWWALVEREGRELLRLGAGLDELWAVRVGGAARSLAPLAEGERVWLVDGAQGSLRLLGRGGARSVRSDPTLAGALFALATPDGGALVLTPGAVLRFDANGRRAAGQGGFDFLCAAIPARRP